MCSAVRELQSLSWRCFVLSIDGQSPEGAYAEALEVIDREILSLPSDTILCPGHGPPVA